MPPTMVIVMVPLPCDHRSEAKEGSVLKGVELGNELSKSLQSSTPRPRSQKLDALRGLDQLDNLGSEGGRRHPDRACVLSIKKFRIFDRKLWRNEWNAYRPEFVFKFD